MPTEPETRKGMVYLVGAGPGDPGLLTVRALELLRAADVVAYDELVSQAILSLVRPEAELLPVGRRHGAGEIGYRLHPEVLARAKAGHTVVRLKAGDPLIGEVVGLREWIAWFECRPLAGRRLLVARARPGRSAIATELRALGAEVLEIPEVEAVALNGGSPLDAALARLHEFRGIVFGCAAGVDAVLSHVPTLDMPVIAVGAAATQALTRHGIASTVSLRGACQEALHEQSVLFQKGPFLLVTAEDGRSNLRNELAKIGAEVEAVAAYRSIHRMPTLPLPTIDLVVLPSSSAARAVLSGDLGKALLGLPMAAIGPQTEEAARQCGAQSVVQAEEDSVASLVSLAVSMMGPEPSDVSVRRCPQGSAGDRLVMIPRLVIAGTSSNVGKTTVMVGLVRALRARGLRVAVFKCGPDYLDPTYHARASGVPCHNLDGWMMGRNAVLSTFTRASQGADIAILEGVMGLFDGASPTSDEGSTAEIAKWLQAPVLLVCDAGGMARSIAALARGFSTFDADLQIAGLICNRIGSRGHLDVLRKATGGFPPVMGGLPKEATLVFADRHLGLHSADRATVPEDVFAAWGDRVSEWCDVDAIVALARAAPALPEIPAMERIAGEGTRCKIGLAFDEAFHFYYDDNLRHLESLGAELVRFSPIRDAHLPDVDGLYFGGGYPEVYAEVLSRNSSMRNDVASFAEAQGPIYGECGGLMYLSNGIRTVDGVLHAMVGLIPGKAEMRDRLQALGYVEVETQDATILGPSGLRFRGHQFRYSDFHLPAEVECVYSVRRRRGGELFQEGYRKGNTLASYVHAHWASNPLLAQGFVQACAVHARRIR